MARNKCILIIIKIIIRAEKVCHIKLSTKDTNDPNRDTASTDFEMDDEETRYTGQQQGAVDVTSDIKEAK